MSKRLMVVRVIQFNSGIYRRRLHAWPAAPYNKFKIEIEILGRTLLNSISSLVVKTFI